jgi:hypothetical protein
MISEEGLYALAEQQIEQIRRLSRPQARRKLQTLGPELLQALTAILFQRSGYEASVTHTTVLEGADIVAAKEGWTVVVQCRGSGSASAVGLPAARDLHAAMLGQQADEAYLVTTAQVAAQARQWAADKPIHLLDGWALVDWIRDSEEPASGPLAGLRGPYVLAGALAGLALIVLALAAVLAYPQISARLGITQRPSAAWVPPTVTDPQPAGPTGSPLATHSASGTATPAPAETPTAAEPSASPSQAAPVPTATPVCPLGADGQLYDLYSSDLLGCATTTADTVWSAWQPFEGGYLLWRDDTDTVYALYGSDSGSWLEIADTWDGSTLPDRGDAPAGRQAPIRGFGHVWATSDEIFQNLGWATDQEKGFCATVQRFEKGFLLRSSAVESCTPNGLFNHARTAGWAPISLAAHAGGWHRAGLGG